MHVTRHRHVHCGCGAGVEHRTIAPREVSEARGGVVVCGAADLCLVAMFAGRPLLDCLICLLCGCHDEKLPCPNVHALHELHKLGVFGGPTQRVMCRVLGCPCTCGASCVVSPRISLAMWAQCY